MVDPFFCNITVKICGDHSQTINFDFSFQKTISKQFNLFLLVNTNFKDQLKEKIIEESNQKFHSSCSIETIYIYGYLTHNDVNIFHK